MTDDGVDIPTINSKGKRRRLPFRWFDLIPIVIAAGLAWRLFLSPMLEARHPYPAPPLRTIDVQGNVLDLRSYRGRVVFIDFFATWCGPCRQSMPLLEAYAAHHPEIQLLTMNVGESRAAVLTFAHELRLAGPGRMGLDPDAKIGDRWGVRGFPTVAGIDPQGRLRDRWFGATPYLVQSLADAEKRYQHP